jgi:hypothetical protein
MWDVLGSSENLTLGIGTSWFSASFLDFTLPVQIDARCFSSIVLYFQDGAK